MTDFSFYWTSEIFLTFFFYFSEKGVCTKMQLEPLCDKTLIWTAVDVHQCCLFAVINPSLSGKVGGLSTVKAVVETSVIAKGECHNELPSLLSDLNKKNNIKKGLKRVHHYVVFFCLNNFITPTAENCFILHNVITPT